MTRPPDVYAQDGVNVDEGDDFSALAGKICRGTFNNSRHVEVLDMAPRHFRGPRGWRFKGLPDGYIVDVAPDGIGTKTIVIDALPGHGRAARDLIAMTGGDITRWGGLPLIFVNVLEVASLGVRGSFTNRVLRELMLGLGEVASEEKLVCFRGETAETGVCVGSELGDEANAKFNWSGFMIGVYLEDRMITGETLAPGQMVVALREYGFRSNGLSSARAALRKQFGEQWWQWQKNDQAKDAISAIARPATLYDRFLTTANGWEAPCAAPRFHPHLITHVTGGGIVGKFFDDMLSPRGLSAELDNLWEPPEIMRQVVEWRDMPEEECYRAFNCGNGLLVVLSPDEVDEFCALAAQFGHEARVCGRITQNNFGGLPHIHIQSGFSGKWLPSYTKKS